MPLIPRYTGPLGNPEEPALRPYKWFLRGFQSFFYQTGKAFVNGNNDFPIVGSVYAFRGMRVGAVELNRSIWTGMSGANLKTTPQSGYKETGKMNKVIEQDPLLRNVADATVVAVSMGAATGSLSSESAPFMNNQAWKSATGIFVAQKALDRTIPVPEWNGEKPQALNEAPASYEKQAKKASSPAAPEKKRSEHGRNFLKEVKRTETSK